MCRRATLVCWFFLAGNRESRTDAVVFYVGDSLRCSAEIYSCEAMDVLCMCQRCVTMNPSRTRHEPVTGQMRLASLVLRWRRYTTLAAIAAKANNIHGSPTGEPGPPGSPASPSSPSSKPQPGP